MVGNAGDVTKSPMKSAAVKTSSGAIANGQVNVSSTGAPVRFVGVEKTYDGETLVVRDLDLDVRPGEFLTLLGPSGSGKTTTLMMLAGFEVPTRGGIYISGRDITHVPPHRRGIGMVFQNYALFPHMSVAENLAFPLSVRGVGGSERTARTKRALEQVQLNDLGSRMPAQLSGGQQQRVALARALIFEPTLVLMDEPLGALDKQLREQMQYEIMALHSQLGQTFVYVTHDQGEALTMSDRVAVFNDGHIQQIDTPKEIYERPKTAFVAQFVGENNRIVAHIERVDGKQAIAISGTNMRIICEAASSLRIGDAVMISIRPEAVFLKSSASAVENTFENTMKVRVSKFVYHGDHVRLHLDFGGETEFLAKVSARDAVNVEVGALVDITWRAQDARAIVLG